MSERTPFAGKPSIPQIDLKKNSLYRPIEGPERNIHTTPRSLWTAKHPHPLNTTQQQQEQQNGRSVLMATTAAVQRKPHGAADGGNSSDAEDDQCPVNGDSEQQSHKQQQAAAVATAAAATVRRLRRQSVFRRIQQHLQRVKSWIWNLIEELFEVCVCVCVEEGGHIVAVPATLGSRPRRCRYNPPHSPPCRSLSLDDPCLTQNTTHNAGVPAVAQVDHL